MASAVQKLEGMAPVMPHTMRERATGKGGMLTSEIERLPNTCPSIAA